MKSKILQKIKEFLFSRKTGIRVYQVTIEKVPLANREKNMALEDLLCTFRIAYHVYSWDKDFFTVGIVERNASTKDSRDGEAPHTIEQVVKAVEKAGFSVRANQLLGELRTTLFGFVTGP